MRKFPANRPDSALAPLTCGQAPSRRMTLLTRGWMLRGRLAYCSAASGVNPTFINHTRLLTCVSIGKWPLLSTGHRATVAVIEKKSPFNQRDLPAEFMIGAGLVID